MMTDKQLFGIRIKSLRQNKQWTQENLAEKMNIATNYLSSIERGKENPTFDMIVKFSEALNVEIWELFDYSHENTNINELRKNLNSLVKGADRENLKLAIKIIRTVTR